MSTSPLENREPSNEIERTVQWCQLKSSIHAIHEALENLHLINTLHARFKYGCPYATEGVIWAEVIWERYFGWSQMLEDTSMPSASDALQHTPLYLRIKSLHQENRIPRTNQGATN